MLYTLRFSRWFNCLSVYDNDCKIGLDTCSVEVTSNQKKLAIGAL